MSVISTDVELSATEIAELHHDIANGLMDLATSQTAATVTSAGSSAINQINQWPKKPTALSGDEGRRAVEHACGHQRSMSCFTSFVQPSVPLAGCRNKLLLH
jgi:hypothetical protein